MRYRQTQVTRTDFCLRAGLDVQFPETDLRTRLPKIFVFIDHKNTRTGTPRSGIGTFENRQMLDVLPNRNLAQVYPRIPISEREHLVDKPGHWIGGIGISSRAESLKRKMITLKPFRHIILPDLVSFDTACPLPPAKRMSKIMSWLNRILLFFKLTVGLVSSRKT